MQGDEDAGGLVPDHAEHEWKVAEEVKCNENHELRLTQPESSRRGTPSGRNGESAELAVDRRPLLDMRRGCRHSGDSAVSVLVDVVAVDGVAMAVVEVVDVAIVFDGLVAAVGAMGVVVVGVGDAGAGTVAFVVVAIVFVVDVAVVEVVDVTVVDGRGVTAFRVVNVGVVVMNGVSGHGDALFSVGWFFGVRDGVEHDVGDVVVGEAVADLFAQTSPFDELRCSQHLQVLRHGRLGSAQRVDKFVDASVLVFGQLLDDLQPQRMGQRAQHL